MSNEANIKIGADGSAAEATWKRQMAIIQQYGTTIGELADPWQTADRAAQRYGNDVRKTIEQNISAQGKYEAALKKLELMAKNGDITPEIHTAAIEKAKQELEAATTATVDLKEAQEDLAKKAKAVMEAMLTPTEKYDRKMQELNQHLKAGTITQETYNRAVTRAKADYSAAAAAANNHKTSLSQIKTGVTSWAAGLVGVSAIMGTVQQTFTSILATQQELSQASDKFSKDMAENQLKLMIQGGFTPQQVEGQMPAIESALLLTPSADLNQGIQIQTELASSGIKTEDVQSGKAMQAALDLKAITNQFGKDIGDPAKAMGNMTKFLMAQGINEPSAKDVGTMSMQLAAAMKDTSFKFPALEQYAQKAIIFSQKGVTATESLAVMASLGNIMSDEVAATGAATFISRLSAAGATKETAKAVNSIGLTTEEVSISKGGPQLFEVIDKVSKAFEGLEGEARNVALKKIFGDEGAAAASALLDPKFMENVKRREETMRTSTESETLLKTFRDSAYGKRAKSQVQEDIQNRRVMVDREGVTYDDMRQNLRINYLKESRNSGTLGKLGYAALNFGGNRAIDIHEMLGFDPQDSPLGGYDPNQTAEDQIKASGASPFMQDRALELLERSVKAQETALQKQQATPPVQVEVKVQQAAQQRRNVKPQSALGKPLASAKLAKQGT